MTARSAADGKAAPAAAAGGPRRAGGDGSGGEGGGGPPARPGCGRWEGRGGCDCGNGAGALLGRVLDDAPVVPEGGMIGQHLLELRELVRIEQSFDLLVEGLQQIEALLNP